ncbi:hypothetical protein HOB10_00095 [Candidatus Parcubacteria bacterium]|jgi:hypothetical protein|nr:hypothetical protein [Candidatus Parcubacteria bacterium]
MPNFENPQGIEGDKSGIKIEGNPKKEWGAGEFQSCPKCGSPGGNFNDFENFCYECSWDGSNAKHREDLGLEPLEK